MNAPPRDFITVDMRGLKSALVERSRAERVSVSTLVRAAVSHELGVAEPGSLAGVPNSWAATASSETVKVSIRLSRAEAQRLADGARAADLSRGSYLAGLVAGIPVLSGSASRTECITALIASSAELSTLSRNINHLTTLLRQGSGRAAQEYRGALDTLGAEVRSHLKLASAALAELQPARRPCTGASRRSIS